MEKIVWNDALNIGVEVVDRAHAKLFKITQKLLDASADPGTDPHTYKELIKYLEAYSMVHFSEEEAYMRSIKYSGYAQHKRIHDNFRDKTLISLKKDLELSRYSVTAVQRFVGIMKSWLTEHIMKEDQAIVKKNVPGRAPNLSEQISLISRSVNRAMQNIFQVDAVLASSEYKGENIGSAVYARQTYQIDGTLRLELLLGIEEALIFRKVNELQKRQMMQQGKLMNNVTLQIFVQLFKHMGKFFQAEREEPLSKENFLNRDQFRAEFMKGYTCRLLFATKSGNFIFCYHCWRVKR